MLPAGQTGSAYDSCGFDWPQVLLTLASAALLSVASVSKRVLNASSCSFKAATSSDREDMAGRLAGLPAKCDGADLITVKSSVILTPST